MANRARIVRDVAGIAGDQRAVTFEEILRIVNRIESLGEFPVERHETRHGYLFTIGVGPGTQIFSVCEHNRGDKHVKPKYVKSFLVAMMELGFYPDEE